MSAPEDLDGVAERLRSAGPKAGRGAREDIQKSRALLVQELRSRYDAALERFLHEGGEPSLNEAYEIGRAAFTGGVGMMKLSDIHNDVVARCLEMAHSPGAAAEVHRKATVFLQEVMSPFEMAMNLAETINTLRQMYEQRARLEAMQELEALKDKFLGVVSHELRTPLNAILGFGSLLEDEVAGELNEQQHQYVRKLIAGADRLLYLVNDLLDMTRIQAGKLHLAPRRVDFPGVVASTIEALEPLAAAKHQELTVRVPDHMPPICADDQRLGQVITNLLSNAIKFTPEGGRIEVRARMDGDCLVCEVEDTGVGIASEDQDLLFKPFSQVGLQAGSRERGTGLGLAITTALIEAHGGSVGVRSEPGKGSVFWFRVPQEGPDGQPCPL